MDDALNTIEAAKRWRQTQHQRRTAERRAKRNEKYDKFPVAINRQPKRQRTRYMGSVTFEWKTGPKRGQQFNQPITLRKPARLSIRGKELWVLPANGHPYCWGEKDPNPQPNPDKVRQWKKPAPDRKARENRFRDSLMERFKVWVRERGSREAGLTMARSFTRAYNRLESKTAKRALAKVYGSVLQTDKLAHVAFSRQIRSHRSLHRRRPLND